MIPCAVPLADVPRAAILRDLWHRARLAGFRGQRQLRRCVLPAQYPARCGLQNSGIEGTRTRAEADRDHVHRAGDGSNRVVQ